MCGNVLFGVLFGIKRIDGIHNDFIKLFQPCLGRKAFRINMISDQPDEDADLLDDEAALDTYLGDATALAATDTVSTLGLPDWPPRAARDIVLSLDGETVSWFKAGHVDWRRAMRRVLRAWVVSNQA